MKFLGKLKKNAWAYFAWLFIVVVAWGWVFHLITMTKTNEKIVFFFGTYSTSYVNKEKLEKKKPEYVKEIETYAYSIEQPNYASFLNTFGFQVSDILVLPGSKISLTDCQAAFSPISSEYQTQFSNYGFYEGDEKAWGIKVHEKGNPVSLISELDFGEGDKEEDFYLFFNKKSIHISGLSGQDDGKGLTGAIEMAKALMTL